jgi:hypothetical protein
MTSSRRALLLGALGLGAALSLAACATTSGGSTGLTQIQGYVADAAATFDRLVPLVTALDPTAGAQLKTLQADADAAAAAFAGLSSPASAASSGQQVLTLISDGFTIIEAIPGLPPAYGAAIGAAQLLLVALGSFINAAPVPTASLALGHADLATARWSAAKAAYSPAAAVAADAKVKAFLAG